MSLNTDALTAVLVSHALATGHFDSVNQHEPGSVPNHGIHCAIWADRVSPARASGLNQTSARVVFNVRVYKPIGLDLSSMNSAEVEPVVLRAVDALMSSYCNDFDLGSNARNIDIFGAHGASLDAQAGYLQMEGSIYRIMTLLVPVIVNDAWEQVP